MFLGKISFQRFYGRDFHSDVFLVEVSLQRLLGNFFKDFLGDNFGSKIFW